MLSMFFFSSRRRHTRCSRDWSSDVCSSDLVAADVRDDGLRNPIKPQVYIPFTSNMWMFTQILVRTRVPPLSIVRDIRAQIDRKSTRLNSSHGYISYAVFCLKKKKKTRTTTDSPRLCGVSAYASPQLYSN